VVGVILTDMVELRKRGKVTGLFALSQLLGLPGGLILGGAITENTTWRWSVAHVICSWEIRKPNGKPCRVFAINLPICILAAGGILMFLKLEPPKLSFIMAVKDLDWIGMALLTGSIISLLYGVTTGGHVYPWGSEKVIASIFFGAFGIAGFVLFEAKMPRSPMMPPRIFANYTAVSGFLSSGIHGLVWFGSAFYFIHYVRP